MNMLTSTFAVQERTPIEVALSALVEYLASRNIIPGLQLTPMKGGGADYIQERAILLPINTKEELEQWKVGMLSVQGEYRSTIFCTEQGGQIYSIQFNPNDSQLHRLEHITLDGKLSLIYLFSREVDSEIIDRIGGIINANYQNNVNHLNRINVMLGRG